MAFGLHCPGHGKRVYTWVTSSPARVDSARRGYVIYGVRVYTIVTLPRADSRASGRVT